MGADGDQRRRALQLLRRRLLFRCRKPAVQPDHRHTERPEPFREFALILRRQDFRGRHHRRLAAGVDRGEAGNRGDDGLAAAHIALQQPLHRMRLGEIAQNFGHSAALRARQAERQLAEKALEQRSVRGQGNRVPAMACAIRHSHRQLLRQQFIELDATPCLPAAPGELGRSGIRRGLVQGADALGDAGKPMAAPDRVRQGVIEHRNVERLKDELAQRVLRQACCGRINRRQRQRQRLALRHDAVARMHHLRAEKARSNLAVGAHQQAFVRRTLKLLQLTAVKIEEAEHKALGVHDKLALRAILHFGLQHAPFDQHRLAGGREFRRGEPGFVLVAVRQMQREVVGGTQPELGELF